MLLLQERRKYSVEWYFEWYFWRVGVEAARGNRIPCVRSREVLKELKSPNTPIPAVFYNAAMPVAILLCNEQLETWNIQLLLYQLICLVKIRVEKRKFELTFIGLASSRRKCQDSIRVPCTSSRIINLSTRRRAWESLTEFLEGYSRFSHWPVIKN